MPLFIQGVRGGNATQAGRSLMPLFLAWAISVAVAARAIVHFGFRRGGMVGASLVAMGNLILVAGASRSGMVSGILFVVGLAVCGLGMGPTSLSFVLAVQHAVNWGQRGVAPGRRSFCARSAARSAWASWARRSAGVWRIGWPAPAQPGIDVVGCTAAGNP